MKIVICIFLLHFSLFASDKERLPEISKKSIDIPSLHGPLVNHAHTSFLPKVNPITGEYVEEEIDLVVAGCEPLSFRRFYGHLSSLDPRYGGWRVNPETSIAANLQWRKSMLFAAVGEENGAMVLLNKSVSHCLPDGRTVLGYSLQNQSSYTYTNLDSLDPHNTHLYFWPEYGNEA